MAPNADVQLAHEGENMQCTSVDWYRVTGDFDETHEGVSNGAVDYPGPV